MAKRAAKSAKASSDTGTPAAEIVDATAAASPTEAAQSVHDAQKPKNSKAPKSGKSSVPPSPIPDAAANDGGKASAVASAPKQPAANKAAKKKQKKSKSAASAAAPMVSANASSAPNHTSSLQASVAPSLSSSSPSSEAEVEVDEDQLRQAMRPWAQFNLSIPVLAALQKLGFAKPTPIQSAVLSKAIRDRRDIIGCAETGSGKTLAFGIPILERLSAEMENPAKYGSCDCLCALILTPTRELAIQVSDHLKAAALYTPVKIMALVGGMSVQKQERLLARRPHVVVATPGRLWEFISTGKQHLVEVGGLRFLVLDEADRMIESGHFPEVSSILQHVNSFGVEADEVDSHDKMLPSESDLQRLQQRIKDAEFRPRLPGAGGDEDEDEDGEEEDQDDEEDGMNDGADEVDEDGDVGAVDAAADGDEGGAGGDEKNDGDDNGDESNPSRPLAFHEVAALPFVKQLQFFGIESEAAYNALEPKQRRGIDKKIAKTGRFAARKQKQVAASATSAGGAGARAAAAGTIKRQTLLFSATLTLLSSGRRSADQQAKALKHAEKMAASGKKKHAAKPDSVLDDLIQRIQFRSRPDIVDLTTANKVAATVQEAIVQAVTEEKDFYLYYFCSRYPGRTLIFVNAISCLRRVLSILTLLSLPVFGLHANMQQRQRLKNLERFKEVPNAILVATDVAARGLDIPLVQHVLHYQLPRTSEIYVHRAGRAGRAQSHGFSVALVAPDEVKNYRKICEVLEKPGGIPPLNVDALWMGACRQRVATARKLDLELNDVRKVNAKTDWVARTSAAAEMMVDADEADEDTRAAQDRRAAESQQLSRIRDLRQHLSHQFAQTMLPKGASRKFVTADASGLDINTRLAILEGNKVATARDDFAQSKATQAQRERQGVYSNSQKLLGKKRKSAVAQ